MWYQSKTILRDRTRVLRFALVLSSLVLLFACGRPVLPVDTHVHRVAGRLGLIPDRTSADAAHDLLQRQVADRMVLDFHVLLIRHGRRTCAARRPRCTVCVLLDRCPQGPQLITHGKADDDGQAVPQQDDAVPHVPES